MMKTEDRTGLEFSVSAQGPEATPAPTWVHLVGTYDRDAGVIQLFLNGKRAAFAPFTTPVKADGPLAIGRAQFDGNPGNFWPGAVGDVAIYQTTLSPAQVAKIYASTKPASAPPPQPAPDPSTYADGLLNGRWDHVFGKAEADVMVRDFADYVDSADEVIVRLGIDRNTWWIGFLFDGKLILENGVPEGARGTLSIEGATLTLHEGGSLDTTWAWKLKGDVLTLKAIGTCIYDAGAAPFCTEERDKMDQMELLVAEHAWIKSGDDPSY
jgi:Concanavalin A-like lectin/glucanases superfamily